jgi:hypothetical protein
MSTAARAIIQCERANTDGVVCECGQIAFRVVEVNGAGNVRVEVPLCGRHYVEAQLRRPAPLALPPGLPPEQNANQ